MLTLKGKSVFSGISIGPLALFHRNTISTAVRLLMMPKLKSPASRKPAKKLLASSRTCMSRL